MSTITELVCPIEGCPDPYHRIKVELDEENEGLSPDPPVSIPVIGCGNPFHYTGFFKPWRWLESTFKLQTETYHYPYRSFIDAVLNLQGEEECGEVAKHLEWNVFAVYQELAELAYEFSWKPWATDPPFVHRERILGETVDINHFLGNILAAIGVTDEEYEAAYRKKQDKNKERAESGSYSALKGGVGEGSDL